MKRIRYVSGLAAICLVVTLAACSGGGGGSDETSGEPSAQPSGEPSEAPAKDIELVVYHTFEPDEFGSVVEKFEDYYKEQTGNNVTVSGVVQEQSAIELEAASGALGADVVVLSLGGLGQLQDKYDVFSKLTYEDDSDGIPEGAREVADRDGFLPLWTAPVWLAYNTNNVAPDEVPTSYEDLLDPRWKGRIGLVDPEGTYIGNTMVWFWAEYLKESIGEPPYGWGYLERLSENDPTLGPGARPLLDQVASGELDVALVGNSALIVTARDGLPIGAVVPKEGTAGHATGVAVVKDGDNVEAAEMFAQWMTSVPVLEDVRDVMAQFPVRTDVAPMDYSPIDIDFTADDAVLVDDRWVADNREENTAKFTELFR